ncbi:MAG: lipopolysaccharide biosynthesis protein [Cryomorphaceae bacterium]|nr:polysaccharide biosynthesis C-terminal domain-containing protein [Flavobacteriales bacterium]
MNALKKLAGQTAVYGVSSIAGRLLNYLLVYLHTRVFVAGEFGAITELYGMVAFLVVMLTYGMETAFFRFGGAAKNPEDQSRVFSTAFISVLTTTGIFLILVLTNVSSIAEGLHYGSNPNYIVYFAVIVGLDVLTTIPFARLRLLNKAVVFVGVNLGSIGLYILLNLFLLMYCPAAMEDSSYPGSGLIRSFYNPEFGIGYVFVANLISSGFKFLLLSPWMRDVFKGFHVKVAKQLYPYALPLLFLGLAGIVNETFDRVFFIRLSPLPEEEARAQLGIYGACYKVAMLLSIGIQAYRYAAEPFIFSLAKKESDDTQAEVMKYYVIAAAFITLTLLCFLDVAMMMVGEELREGRDVVPILLLAYFCFGVVFNLSFWYKLTDKTRYGALIAFAGAAVTVVMNVLLIPHFSYYGCAWATLGAYAAMMLISYGLGQKHNPIPYQLRAFAFYILLAAALYAGHRLIGFESVLKYGTGALAVGTFAAVVWVREQRLRNLKLTKND